MVDSGSTDDTVAIARSLGADVVEQPWLGFSAQREFALRLPEVRNDWVYFVDADEWVSPQLAGEIAAATGSTDLRGFSSPLPPGVPGHLDPSLRLVRGSWVVRLVDRRYTKYDGSLVGERASVDGTVERLPMTSWTKTARDWPPGCTSTSATRSWRPSAAANQLPYRSDSVRCELAKTPGL